MLTLGIDDAGRGPLIGPMVLAGALLTGMQERKLKGENIRDSKDVPQSERVKLAKVIKVEASAYKVVQSTPDEIDAAENLNTLEARKAAEIVDAINVGKYRKDKMKVVVDCPSVNTVSWRETMIGFLKHKDNLNIICEHKADVNYVSVGAASIIAKTVREEEVAKIKKEFGNIGSGYPSDPTTKKFLVEHGKELKDSGIFRKSWNTWKKVFPEAEKGQMSLGEF